MTIHPRAVASIASQAFRAMELGPFSSFADDTPQAQDANEQYVVAKRMCLEACDWSFASTIQSLPQADGVIFAPDPDLPYSYRLPAECVRFLHPVDQWIRWRLDGRLLRADTAGPLTVRFTADINDETIMSAAFQTAVALRLAALLSPRWVGAENKTQALEARAEQALKLAMKPDARSASMERYDGHPADIDDWAGWACR